MSLQEEFAQQFSRSLGATHAYPFWKARVALYALLRALGIGKGDEVIVPGYTCVMDVNPIMYVGARPRYADIDPQTFNASAEAVESLVTERTKLILCQHTYGIPADVERLKKIADDCGAWLIEDCCLSLGSRFKGQQVGTFGQAAYWSFQWNKIFTTGLGGMATTSSQDLNQAMDSFIQQEGKNPGRLETTMLSLQRGVHRAVIWPRTAAGARSIFRRLGALGLAIGSSDGAEFRPEMPPDFCKMMSRGQARAGVRQLGKLSANLQHRKRISRFYDEALSDAAWRPLELPNEMDPVLVGYPVRVEDKTRVLRNAPGALIELGSWFESPLHPEETPLEAYGYQRGMCPHAEQACEEVVLLPTHSRTSVGAADRAVRFLVEETRQASD